MKTCHPLADLEAVDASLDARVTALEDNSGRSGNGKILIFKGFSFSCFKL